MHPYSHIRVLVGLLVCITLLMDSTGSYASEVEPDSPDLNGWLSLGLGAGDVGLSLGFRFSLQYGHGLLTLRYTDNFLPFFDERICDTGMLIGVSTLSKYSKVSLSVGLAVARIDSMKHAFWFISDEKRSTTVGVPVEVQLSITPIPILGLGLTVFANYNNKRSFGGVHAHFLIGKMR